MEELRKILKINKELDQIFIKKYGNDKKYYEKNCIELLVELGEFVNETKCFKYWSVKAPDKEKVLEEYADTITIVMSFFTTFNMELNSMKEHSKTKDKLLLINEIYKDASLMIENGNEELVNKILSNIMYLGELLELSKEEIYEACYKKMDIVKERLNSDY